MKASELKNNVNKTGSHYFDHSSMRFFGDTMRNYGVREVEIVTNYDLHDNWVQNGLTLKAWELYRKQPVKHGLQKSAYFDAQTFARVYPAVK